MMSRNLSPQQMFIQLANEHVPRFRFTGSRREEFERRKGLPAPRPLLIDIGIHDTCCKPDTALQCQRQLERIYQAAGAADKLELDLFPGEHAWGGNKSVAFFRKHLGGPS
jgi:hypothetical protein